MKDWTRSWEVLFSFAVKSDKIKPGDKVFNMIKAFSSNSFNCYVFISNDNNPNNVNEKRCFLHEILAMINILDM